MIATAVVLKHLIGPQVVYQVPNFQRRYRWQREHWNVLFEDLIRECESSSSEIDGHFLGSIVLHKYVPEFGADLPHFMVIDGQQRLTTVLLLLAALRDKYSELGQPHTALEIEENLLSNQYADDAEIGKLRPTPFDLIQYEATIHGNQPSGRFGEAYDYFVRRISNYVGSSHENVEALHQTLLNRMLVVRIEVERKDAINSIFNTLNSKGLPLNAGDLIKNELLLTFSDQEALKLYKDKWAPIEDELVLDFKGKVDDRALVTFFWARELPFSKNATKKNLFTVFEERHRAAISSAETPSLKRAVALAEIDSIWRDFAIYRNITDMRTARSRIPVAIRNEIKFFKAWASEIHVPINLWILRTMIDRPDLVSEAQAFEGMRLLRSFLVRRALAGLPSNNLNAMLSAIPSILQKKIIASTEPETLTKVLTDQFRKPGFQWPSDAEILRNARNIPILKSIKAPQVTALLELATGTEVRNKKVLRVIPKSPNFEDLKDIGASDDSIEFAYSVVPFTLGNLFLSGTLKEQSTPAQTAANCTDLFIGDANLGSVLERIQLRTEFLFEEILSALDQQYSPSPESANVTAGDRLEYILPIIPERNWTTIDALEVMTQLSRDELLVQLASLPPYHVRFIRNNDGSVLSGLPTSMKARIENEDLQAQARFTAKSRLTDEDLYELLEDAEDMV